MTDDQNTLAHLVPKDWNLNEEEDEFWVTGYRVFLPSEIKLNSMHFYDIDDARIIFFSGNMNYPAWVGKPSFETENGTIRIKNLDYKQHVSPEGTWMLIIQPFLKGGVEKVEYLIKQKSGCVAALYVAINGYNMAYERLFDFSNKMGGLHPVQALL